MFRNRTLDGILSNFDKVATQLNKHILKKSDEQLSLLELRADIDDEIDATAQEVDRSHRVLSKVRELLA